MDTYTAGQELLACYTHYPILLGQLREHFKQSAGTELRLMCTLCRHWHTEQPGSLPDAVNQKRLGLDGAAVLQLSADGS